MALYRIMLVDDEEEVRKGIMNKIDWERVGFRMIGDAENGEEALEKIELLEPDVVMTDIRMPYMDGLALAGRIRQKYPSIKVLIFSGFDDFEYAQQAIKLNVTEYILKPVNVEELTEILDRVRSNLDEEIEQRRDVSLLRESYLKNFPIIRELYLSDLVRGNVDVKTMAAKLKEFAVDILDAERWVAAVIDIEDAESQSGALLSLHREKELIPISVKQLAEDYLRACCRCTVFNAVSGIVVIAALDEPNTLTGLIDLMGDVCRESRRIFEVTITIGIGQSRGTLCEIGKSYQTAVDALGYKAIVGAGHTIYINDVEPVSRGKLQFDSRDEAELAAVIKFGPGAAIEEAVRTIVDKMEDARVHARQYQVYMLSVVNCLTRLMQQHDLDLSELLAAGPDYFELLEQLQRPEDFYQWTIRVTLQMHAVMNQARDNTAKQLIVEAQKYIGENYQNPDLSVEMLCRHLHLSPAYFSTVFKKETGQAYIAYLTEIRLNKAVELLRETEDKTYVIAAKVGYQEQNYFSYVFKKRYGVSPTKFRGA